MGLELGKRGGLILEKAEGSAEARSCKALVGRGKEFGLYSKFSNKPLISLQQGNTRICGLALRKSLCLLGGIGQALVCKQGDQCVRLLLPWER